MQRHDSRQGKPKPREVASARSQRQKRIARTFFVWSPDVRPVSPSNSGYSDMKLRHGMQKSLKLQAWKHVNPVRNALPGRYRAVANKLIQILLAEGKKRGAPWCARRAKLKASYYTHRIRPELKKKTILFACAYGCGTIAVKVS